jgi:ferredoxin
MEIDLARCIGCGLCLSTCPEEAVSMTPKPGVQEPPLTILSLLAGIAAKRGLPSGNIERFVRKTSMASNARTWELLYRLHLAKPIINRLAKKGYV